MWILWARADALWVGGEFRNKIFPYFLFSVAWSQLGGIEVLLRSECGCTEVASEIPVFREVIIFR